jgi:hypothetical protein
MEESRFVCRFLEASFFSGNETAKELGISVTEVSRCKERVYDWCPDLQALVEAEKIPPSTGHAIHKIQDPEKKQEALKLAAEGRLTRDAAFGRAQASKNGLPPSEKPRASRIKVALEQGSVTICGPDLAPQTTVALLAELLKKARKLLSRGLTGDAFVLALRDAYCSKKGT